jgi:hypothetical protein
MAKLKNYTAISNLVLFDERLTSKDKLIYWAIKYFAFKDKDWAIPGLTTIAKLTGYSARHISTSIQHLEELGYLKVIRRGGKKSNKYILTSIAELNRRNSATENGSTSVDSQFRQDDSRFDQHDSHLGTTQADGHRVDTSQNSDSSREELQGEELQGGKNTSINKKSERLNTGEEKQSDLNAGEKKLDSLSLQESKTNGSIAGTIASGDGSATPSNTGIAFTKLFSASELLSRLKSNSQNSNVIANYMLEIFKVNYELTEGSSYVLVNDQIEKALRLSITAFKWFVEYLGSHESPPMTIEHYCDEMEKFIAFAFRNKKDWAFKDSLPVLELFHHNFTSLVNRYDKRRAFERSIEEAEHRQLESYERQRKEIQRLEAAATGQVQQIVLGGKNGSIETCNLVEDTSDAAAGVESAKGVIIEIATQKSVEEQWDDLFDDKK